MRNISEDKAWKNAKEISRFELPPIFRQGASTTHNFENRIHFTHLVQLSCSTHNENCNCIYIPSRSTFRVLSSTLFNYLALDDYPRPPFVTTLPSYFLKIKHKI
ncbi:unnamed protein product [Amoebophrya sp. A25]|nr:unnamed protein product [Amoebophrya sp. A25]|eukprot:GSA25T00024998001.1